MAVDDIEIIEHTFQRLMWMEQRKFALLLAEHEFTLPQFLVLVLLQRCGKGCPIGALADSMVQSYPTMTGIIDRLEKRELVVRERISDGDRRKVVVNLTREGERLLDRAMAARRAHIRQALTHFSAHDRRELLRLLKIYLNLFEKENV